jgi:hypothetical protein
MQMPRHAALQPPSPSPAPRRAWRPGGNRSSRLPQGARPAGAGSIEAALVRAPPPARLPARACRAVRVAEREASRDGLPRRRGRPPLEVARFPALPPPQYVQSAMAAAVASVPSFQPSALPQPPRPRRRALGPVITQPARLVSARARWGGPVEAAALAPARKRSGPGGPGPGWSPLWAVAGFPAPARFGPGSGLARHRHVPAAVQPL